MWASRVFLMGKRSQTTCFASRIYIPRKELERNEVGKASVGGGRQEVRCNEQRESALQDEYVPGISRSTTRKCAEHHPPCTEKRFEMANLMLRLVAMNK